MEEPRKGLSLVATFTGVVLFIVTFAVGLSALLNEFSFEKSYEELVASRYEYSLKDMGRSIELSLGLGLSLGEAKNIGALIRESAAEDPYIRSVLVYDDEGNILFSSKAGEDRGRVPSTWPGSSGDRRESLWSREQDRAFVLGYPLFNPFNQYEGTLALSYSRDAVSGVVGKVRSRLMLQALGVLVVSGLVGALVIWLALGGFVRRLSRISRGLDEFQRTGRMHPLSKGRWMGLEADFDRFQRDVQAVEADIPAEERTEETAR
ncbi:hypothetical protein [Thiohalorhabdus methylotrophus]|uniref:HAMP domain-containing protein n=1 Tax=Thiohalorhabdus methylotrophus TaxID=3242694 RepID=A0ABV4TSE1_9GAMM